MISFLLFSLVDECLGSFLSHKIGVSPYQAKSSSLCSSLKGNADVLHFVCVLSVSSVKSGSSSVSGSVSGSECTLGGGLGVFARFLPLVAFFGGEGGTESTVGHSVPSLSWSASLRRTPEPYNIHRNTFFTHEKSRERTENEIESATRWAKMGKSQA